jgi:hypothetical protein
VADVFTTAEVEVLAGELVAVAAHLSLLAPSPAGTPPPSCAPWSTASCTLRMAGRWTLAVAWRPPTPATRRSDVVGSVVFSLAEGPGRRVVGPEEPVVRCVKQVGEGGPHGNFTCAGGATSSGGSRNCWQGQLPSRQPQNPACLCQEQG